MTHEVAPCSFQVTVCIPAHADCTMQTCKDLPDLTLNLKDDPNDVFRLLQFIKPAWKKVQVRIKNLSGGHSCHMLRCANESGESVIVRVRKNLEGVRDPSFEREIVKVMSSKGFFPPLLAVFQNGFCYEYIPGRPIFMSDDTEIAIDETQLRHVAETMANIHSVIVPGYDYKRSEFFNFVVGIMSDAKSCFEGCPSKEELIEEIRLIEEFVSEIPLQSPLVTIHGDPHGGNMVWNEKENKMTFVDWEFWHVAPRAYDIAYFFHTFGFYGNYRSLPVNKPPEMEKNFCMHYLKRWNELNNKPSPTEEEIQQLLLELKYYLLVVKVVAMSFVVRFDDIVDKDRKEKLKFWQFNYDSYIAAKEELVGIKTFGRPTSKPKSSK